MLDSGGAASNITDKTENDADKDKAEGKAGNPPGDLRGGFALALEDVEDNHGKGNQGADTKNDTEKIANALKESGKLSGGLGNDLPSKIVTACGLCKGNTAAGKESHGRTECEPAFDSGRRGTKIFQ